MVVSSFVLIRPSTQVRDAFDLSKESPADHERFGKVIREAGIKPKMN